MAGTEGTSAPDEPKAEVQTKKEEKASAKKQVRKYFLPETGQVVEADNVEEAAKQLKVEKGNKG